MEMIRINMNLIFQFAIDALTDRKEALLKN